MGGRRCPQPWGWAAVVLLVVLMTTVPVSQAGTVTLMFHYHKTGHDLILSIAKSLVARRMVTPPTPLYIVPSHLWRRRRWCQPTMGRMGLGWSGEAGFDHLKGRRL